MLTYLNTYIYLHTSMQMFVVTRVRACRDAQVHLVRAALNTSSVCALARKTNQDKIALNLFSI